MTELFVPPVDVVRPSLLPGDWRAVNAPWHTVKPSAGTPAAPLDVSADATLEGWILCNDGRTLMEYAKGDPR